MSTRPVLDVSRLPPIAYKQRAPLWWAAWSVILIEGTMFGLLIAGYFYLRLSVDVWPPPGVSFPGVLLPTIELALFALSCVPAYYSTEAAVKLEPASRVALWLAANLILAVAALVFRIIEWRSFNFDWASSTYGSMVWMILGLHTFDVSADILLTAVLLVIALSGRMGDKQRGGVDFDSVTWYFLVAIWVPLYLVIYWAPYWVRASR